MSNSRGARSGTSEEHGEQLIVVGVGASAGGVDVLKRLFASVPEDIDMAFVVVMHLASDTESQLADILSRETSLRVKDVEDGDELASNTVYLAPPGLVVTVTERTLRLHEPRESETLAPINAFFRSLSAAQEINRIAIVLSGMGSDGGLGLREIRANDGLTFVQNPATAEYAAMPRNAIEASPVDRRLEPEEIAGALVEYRSFFSSAPELRRQLRSDESKGPVQKILSVVRSRTGHDFSQYKSSTLERRIRRRMSVHRVPTFGDYLEFVKQHPEEADELFQDALIGVTSFFRDESVFETLRDTAFTELFRDNEKESVRIWVPACSSGEEAYTIAVVLKDFLDDHDLRPQVSIFATDVNEQAIDRARRGTFPSSAAADIPERYVKSGFRQQGGKLQVTKDVREMMVFSVQNAIDDPPFTDIDLISCRNFLIYLNQEVQKKIIHRFHYSLSPGGMLLLGSSETVRTHPGLFEVVSKGVRLFRVRPGDTYQSGGFEISRGPSPSRSKGSNRDRGPIPLRTRVERFLLERRSDPTVFINDQRQVEFIHGRTGKWLEPPSGEPNANIIEMARNGLEIPLRGIIQRAFAVQEVVREYGVRVQVNDEYDVVDLTATPIPAGYGLDGLLAITFTTGTGSGPAGSAVPRTGSSTEADQEQLTEELHVTRERLQSAIEQLETSNEELKSSVEEYQSTNEELQSSNEELESSKEELQSLNEELTTVNSELQSKNEELEQSYEEMQNFLDSLDVPIVFLDEQLRVKRFTKAVSQVIRLSAVDINRSLADINMSIAHDTFFDELREVIESSREREWIAENKDGTVFLIRARPYTDVDRVRTGLLVSFLPQRAERAN